MAKRSSKASKRKMVDLDEEEEEDVLEVEEVEEKEEEGEEEEEEEDEEGEEEEEEDEVEEEEEEKVTKKRSAKARSKAKRRKERVRKRRNRLIAGCIVLIFVGATLGALFIPIPPTSLDVVVLQTDKKIGTTQELGIELSIDTIDSGLRTYTGEYQLKISVDGETTLSKTGTVSKGGIYLDIPYSEFLTKNGEYTFDVEVAGVKGTATEFLDAVVEDITIVFGTDDSNGGYTNITAWMSLIRYTSGGAANTSVEAMPGQEMRLAITDPGGTVKYKDMNMEEGALAQFSFDANLRGTYTFKATFVNDHINTASEYWSVTKEEELAINARPFVEAGPDQRPFFVPVLGVRVEVDGSGSYDDGEIVEYEWNFGEYTSPDDPHYGEDVVVSTEPTAEYRYYEIGNYTVTLTVKDNGLPGEAGTEKYNTDQLIVFII